MPWDAISIQKHDDVNLLAAPGVMWPDGAQAARDALVRHIPDAQALGLHGFFFVRNGDYHAGVELDTDHPEIDDALRPETIVGGWYAQTRVEDWPSRSRQIPAIFERTQRDLEAMK